MFTNNQIPVFSCLVFLFCLPFLTGFIEINIGDNNQVNTGTVSTDCLEGNNKTGTESREIGKFSSLIVAGSAFDLKIKEGEEPSLSLTADKNLLPYIETNLTEEKLTIRASRSVCSQNPMIIDITSPGLHSVTASGANTLVMQGQYQDLEVYLSGASDLTINGKAEKLGGKLEGSTTLEAEGLKAEIIEIEAHGSSTATVHAEKSLKARSYGASDITYSGKPAKLDIRTSGAGDISSHSHE